MNPAPALRAALLAVFATAALHRAVLGDVTSHNGLLVAWVASTPDRKIDTALGDDEATEIWVRSTVDGRRRMLVRGHPALEPKDSIAAISNLHFSLDDGVIYFDSVAWVTSGAVHAVNVESGREWFICDGSVAEIISSGPQAGNLLIDRALIKTDANGDSTGRSFYRWMYTRDGFAVAELGPI